MLFLTKNELGSLSFITGEAGYQYTLTRSTSPSTYFLGYKYPIQVKGTFPLMVS